VLAESLTYLDEPALTDLHDRVAEIEKANRPGVLIEAGCALGGSAIVLAAAKSQERPLYVYDVFGLIPPPSEHDGPDVQERYRVIRSGESPGIGGNRYYGYEADLLGKVKENFRRHGLTVEEHNVHLVKGLFEDTLHVPGRVALAHLDGDWYQSVLTCLRRIEPHLGPAGVLVIDDYDAWSGCRKAVDEYFADKGDRYQFVRGARLQILRR
jgi:asparagine synthase (glutamine-hydrolysing)